MDYQLAPYVSACRIDDRLVFLCTRSDRYFMLPLGTETALQEYFAVQRLTFASERRLEQLRATSVLEAASRPGALALCAPADAEGSFLDDGPRPLRLAATVCAAVSFQLARRRLRRAGLRATLARLSRVEPTGDVRSGERVSAEAAAFAALRLVIDPLDRCLPLSIGLVMRARRHDPEVELVLGVRMKPFAAHAWVQQGTRVLNDDVDAVRTFTPILRI